MISKRVLDVYQYKSLVYNDAHVLIAEWENYLKYNGTSDSGFRSDKLEQDLGGYDIYMRN